MDAMTPPGMLAAQPQMQAPAMQAPPMPPASLVTHDVKLLRTRKVAKAKVVSVPPEEFGIERNARSIPESNYCFHRIPTHTEGSLIAQGYDAEVVKELPTYAFSNNTEQFSRDTVDEEMWANGDDSNRAARPVEIIEHYIWMDYEGNDKPCLYKVTTGSTGQVLTKDGEEDVEEFDAMPFASATPVPIPHRFFGRSIADLVMPAQREKTALKRGALDNMYQHNNPRVEVAEQNAGPNTLDDLLVSRPGGVVRTKTFGGLNWQVIPDITGSVYPMLQYIDAEIESRTGLSKQSQGIDANALQNQSATAVAQVFSASQLRVKLIARSMAEGVRDVFSLLHATIRKHGQEAQTVRLRGSWKQVDPRNWKTRDDLTIHVGLGTGGKAQQFAQTMALANFQKELIAGGKPHMVGDDKLFNTASELTKIMGHKNPDKFFDDPSAKNPQTGQLLHPAQPPQPPEAVQVAQIKAQTDQQSMQVQSQLDQQADQRKAQIEQVQAQADIASQNEKTKAEMIQSQQDFNLKKELAILEFNLQRELKLAELEMQREMHQQTLAQSQQAHQQQMQAGVFKVAAGAEAHDMKMEQMNSAPKPKGNGK